ncbi:hypothetical protein [uncultured Anaerococcus sp.]|uniref:hypothetical protein n=1 Tax=uncultured Anaerococcus sp. TaxID=293428 RepID=UPI0025DF9741|nr:hypothetical protein [uncultured Anaerococcus sp.]
MSKREILVEKQEELRKLNEKINKNKKPAFIKSLLKPLGLALVSLALAKVLKFSDSQSLGLVILVFFISIFIFTAMDKKKIQARDKDLKNKRISLQKEIVGLMREVKNEGN